MVVDISLLLDLGLIIIVAAVIGFLVKLLKQPSLIAYIIAGLLIGPAGLGALGVNLGGFPLGLGGEQIENIRILSELGVAFMLFYIGIETDFSKLFELRKTLLVGGVFHVFALFAISGLVVLALGIDLIQAVYIGLILAFSSTLMVVKILSDKHEINTIQGRLMIGFLLIEDILVILLLPLVQDIQAIFSLPLIWNIIGSAIILFGLAFVLSRFVLPRLISFASKSHELFYLTSLSVCFGFIGLAYTLNFSIAIGAFVGGLALSTLTQNIEIIGNIRGLRDFFATIFFVTLGMQLSFNFTAFPLQFLILALAVIYFLKPLIFFLITFLGGYGTKIAFTVAVALTQVSEFSFILLNQGYAAGTGPITQSIFSLLILLIALSMATTPYMMEHTPKLYSLASRLASRFKLSKYFARRSRLEELESFPKMKGKTHIVLAGCGALGSNLARTLSKHFNLIVIDHDPDVVSDLIQQNIPAVCASVENEEVWTKVNLKQTDLLIITIPRIQPSLYLLTYAKEANPKLTVFIRAHYFMDAVKLYEAGADYVILPDILASNALLKTTHQFLETKKTRFLSVLKDEYMKYLKEKAEEEKQRFKLK